jgi:hypothetical protein
MRKDCGAFLALTLLGTVLSHADGGAIVARRTIDGLGVTVFASPTPLRAGPIDVSVLLQQGERPVLDATVELAWRTFSTSSPDWLPPCCTMNSPPQRIPAVQAHSNNKFLYSAIVPVKSSGPSELLITIRHGGGEAVLSCEIDAAPPLPPAVAFWPWLMFPPVAIVAFAIHQTLVRSRQNSR